MPFGGRVAALSVAVSTALSLTVTLALSGPAGGAGTAGTLSNAQAEAAALEAQIQTLGQQIDALDQQYEADLAKKVAVDRQISATEHRISVTKARIVKDKQVLHKAAIDAYVTGGTSAASSTLFAGSQTAAMDSGVYTQVVAGDLHTSLADLNTAVAQLDADRQTLKGEDAQAAAAVAAAQGAVRQAQSLQVQEQSKLNEVKGHIAVLVAQQQAAQAAAARAAAAAALRAAAAASTQATSAQSSPPPPPPAGGNAGAIAVRAAETQLGVPYVWGASDPGVGFDCSGLTMWAWGQAGVSLPHYSGAQMADSTPVPVSALQPGDLLFYGPGGSAHVAMYVGGGEMIEATFPGTVVRIDPIRLGTGFAGAGRP